ncbi:MAG TPA: hypothetical protein VIP11_25410 [Gemmatimonadaceae bacterium]
MSTSLIITLAMCTNAIIVLGGFSIWLGYRARRRPTIADEALARELREIRESIDALSVEVERIGESQRFTARILADASSMRPTFPSQPPKTITPH